MHHLQRKVCFGYTWCLLFSLAVGLMAGCRGARPLPLLLVPSEHVVTVPDSRAAGCLQVRGQVLSAVSHHALSRPGIHRRAWVSGRLALVAPATASQPVSFRSPAQKINPPAKVNSIAMTYQTSNFLFIGGFVVAGASLFGAFFLPTVGLGVLVGLLGLVLGLGLSLLGFSKGYGKGPGGMR